MAGGGTLLGALLGRRLSEAMEHAPDSGTTTAQQMYRDRKEKR
jgi:hypothetical protein